MGVKVEYPGFLAVIGEVIPPHLIARLTWVAPTREMPPCPLLLLFVSSYIIGTVMYIIFR